ncbi:hypothetical protein PAXRUDRAFT_164697 [Paxillus rubicundulus Ve08.2h10]|uniref:Uncharacterized protein n=1 Tax=Paxillus rubicundulus Ve08.2h10 TaxID=930991 RepID=A0A0D0DBZ7_9AGAM|nr:hypothetical protein PAXRUDRAFT_164697 [Paxillus rubicundulus Ve08.2h10]
MQVQQVNIAPDKHYHKLHFCTGGFIPGLEKPKTVNSFLFPGMHDLAAIKNACGLPTLNVLRDTYYISNLYLIFTRENSPGLIYCDGMVGHGGKKR